MANRSHITRFRSSYQLPFVAALAFAVVSPGCGRSLNINIFPDSKDIQLGKQIDEEIRKSPKEYPLLQNHPEVKTYVEEIGRSILNSSEVKKRGTYAYKFEIIHDDSMVNAFCTPGGYIYVYTGLLRFVDNEATLAGVLGHEIAHAERRHATRRMTSAFGIQILLAIVLGESPKQSAQIASNLFAGLGVLANSRSDEIEADTYSMRYLQSTEYFPGGIRYFFEKLSSGKKGGAFDRLLSTHPLPEDRVNNVESLLRQMGDPAPADGNLFETRYQEFRKRLP
jgi:beta-barrel assembly-enhancing protease